ncbi:twin-arginine translocation signal domain-containing protein [Halococcus salsus]|uniref:twin-arginine translocation signal domain-containing protein n=1 Tax=Halococcus salsus TaxID=2162894 RepID=UPI00135725E4|nr:twin-arginine translocation signal domain-containing protein [Halococcus salsus]
MQRRRFLAGVASGGAMGVLAGCMGAGEGVDARRVTVNATYTFDGVALAPRFHRASR